MARKFTVLSGICLVFAVAVLVTGSLIVDLFRPSLEEFCSKDVLEDFSDFCDFVKYNVVAGSLGIIAGLLQIAVVGVTCWGVVNNANSVCGLHLIISALAAASFIIKLTYDEFEIASASGKAKYKAFLLATGLDSLFSFLVVFALCLYKLK